MILRRGCIIKRSLFCGYENRVLDLALAVGGAACCIEHALQGSGMKLPRITIEYYEEESFAPGKLSFPLIMGFGVHWAWVYLFMFGGSSPFSSQAGGIHSVLFLVSATCLALTLLCYGVFLSAARRLFSTPEKRNRNRFAAAFLVLAGMALMLMTNAVPGMSLVFSTAAGVLTGVGSAVLLMSYGVSFSVCDLATLSVSVAASFLVSVVLFVALVALDTVAPAAGMVVVLALPLMEALCLKACSTQLVDRLEFNSMTMPVHRGRFALHVVAPCVAFGIILSTLRMRAASLLIGVGIELAPSVFFAGVLVAVLIVLAMYTQRQANNFEFRTLCPVVALLLASLVLPGASEGSWAMFALFASYLMLEACMWIMCADISQHFRISAFTVFGFGRGALAAGSVVVYALSSSEGIIGHAMRSTEGLVTLALVAITLGVALLPHASELRLTLRRGRQCPAFATSVDPVVDLREADAMPAAASLEGDAACPGTYAAVAEGYVAAQMRVAAENAAGVQRASDRRAAAEGVSDGLAASGDDAPAAESVAGSFGCKRGEQAFLHAPEAFHADSRRLAVLRAFVRQRVCAGDAYVPRFPQGVQALVLELCVVGVVRLQRARGAHGCARAAADAALGLHGKLLAVEGDAA